MSTLHRRIEAPNTNLQAIKPDQVDPKNPTLYGEQVYFDAKAKKTEATKNNIENY